MVISGEDVCCSLVFDTLVGVLVFSVMSTELLMTSAIIVVLRGHECGMFVMCCMQCCMFKSSVL